MLLGRLGLRESLLILLLRGAYEDSCLCAVVGVGGLTETHRSWRLCVRDTEHCFSPRESFIDTSPTLTYDDMPSSDVTWYQIQAGNACGTSQ